MCDAVAIARARTCHSDIGAGNELPLAGNWPPGAGMTLRRDQSIGRRLAEL
ncbi:MAG TPA: hypothetical protein VHZ99_02620 [Steroidobacteraceae bacterium]|nr:hypothetical protein [Steroidobacteraceae bacterium]